MAEMARQQLRQFWRGLQVCFCQIYVFVQKRMFYTRTGRTAWCCVERAARVSVTATCRLVRPVPLSGCVFLWVKSQTVPQLSLNKFRAPLGYRGLVLGLECLLSFSVWVLRMKHVQTRPPSDSRRHHYVTRNCGQCGLPILDTCSCACTELFIF